MSIKHADLVKLSNGAQFYTADLHVHTFGGSPDVKDKSMTVEAVVDAAVRRGVHILAITDHNTTRNTQKSIDHAQQYVGQILVLAGVEVTTANGHMLAYFAPDALDRLNSFIGRINIVNSGTSESHTSMSMADVATEASRLGGICVAAHIGRAKTGFETLAPGYPNWKKDIISHAGIVGLEVDDLAHIPWYSADDENTPAGAERKKLLGLRSVAPGGSARPVLAKLQSSDAHTLKAFEDAQSNRLLTRFKMDQLSFDGVKTAMADPEARVRIVAQLPPSVPRVLGMYVDGGFLHNETYRFSDNLTCFIGGRGTGKSTALKCLAHALNVASGIGDYDNDPDSIVVYCQDAQGIVYKYERMKGSSEPTVQAAENRKVMDAPPDVFRIEYYGQGDLARVAEDPLANAHLLQEFLDRHTHLSDLISEECDLVELLSENGTKLRPLEAHSLMRAAKLDEQKQCDQKIQLAEEGQLKTIAAQQAAIGAERALAKTLEEVSVGYSNGITLRSFRRDFDGLIKSAGKLTESAESTECLLSIRATIDNTNKELNRHEQEMQSLLTGAAKEIQSALTKLAAAGKQMDLGIAQEVDALQKAGLSASLAEHSKVVARRGQLAKDLAILDRQQDDLIRLRGERAELATKLADTRDQLTRRRKEQIRGINNHLARSIDDYTVAIVYAESGLWKNFFDFLREKMQGSYLQEDSIKRLCQATTPRNLASMVVAHDAAQLVTLAGLPADKVERMLERLSKLEVLHELEVLAKPPCPIIKVLTKSHPSREIPVKQLSDGQKHTILLTVAMVADTDMPLVIDQPEDDLDNAFIFSSVVRTLRMVKERRQIILVTHNANLAVLGDAEMLFPMKRTADRGHSVDAGSIDRLETKQAAQQILEGGEIAFLRRKEIYGH